MAGAEDGGASREILYHAGTHCPGAFQQMRLLEAALNVRNGSFRVGGYFAAFRLAYLSSQYLCWRLFGDGKPLVAGATALALCTAPSLLSAFAGSAAASGVAIEGAKLLIDQVEVMAKSNK